MQKKSAVPSHSNYELRAPADGELYMASTEAQNAFGRVLDLVARNTTVLITRHNSAQAVVISYDRYRELTRGESPTLDTLSARFDELLPSMQSDEAQEAVLSAFRASPEELSRAAVAAARSPTA